MNTWTLTYWLDLPGHDPHEEHEITAPAPTIGRALDDLLPQLPPNGVFVSLLNESDWGIWALGHPLDAKR
jgi:hypothetical protein